jgi:pimeloyl-ACP methyl ester carboxylesterase
VTDKLLRRKVGALDFFECGRGTPFLLLHGLSETSASWTATALTLAPHFRVIAPDLLGFGASDLPDDNVYMEEQARAVKTLLNELDIDSLFVAGHDFGGPVAMTLMRVHPELRVRGVVLSNTNMFTDTYVPPPLRAAGIPVLGWLVYKLMAGSRFGLWMTYRMSVAQKRTLSWQEFSRDVDARSLRLTQRIFQRSLADLPANYRAVEDQLRQTQAPGLVLWGDRDPFFGIDVGRRTAAAMPNAVFRTLPGTGHFGPHESPQEYAASIIEVFGRLRAGGGTSRS